MRGNRVPTLRGLFELDYTEFRESVDNFVLSRCLVEVLTEGEGLALFRELLRRLRDSSNPWEVFSSIYPVESVEKRWRRRIEDIADGSFDR